MEIISSKVMRFFTEAQYNLRYYPAMAEENDKVKVELEMPKDQVSVHAASEVLEFSGPGEKVEERQDKAIEVLKETREELHQTKKEIKELKEKVEKSEEEDEGDDSDSTIKQATGYELGEIIGAPLSAPEPKAKGKPKLSQLRLVLVGFAVALVGVILWPALGFAVGLSIIIVGAVFVAIGVLVRI